MRRPTLHLIALGLLVSCGGEERVAGNSTSTGNHQSAGRILTSSGESAAGVWIECSPDSSAPWGSRLPGWSALTDSSGRYRCTDLPLGRIGIAAYDPSSGLSRWRADTIAIESTPDTAIDTLAAAGTLHVALPPGSNGILYFTGLTRTVSVHGEQDFAIDDIPAGWCGALKFARTAASSSIVDSGLRIPPGAIDSAGYTRQQTRIRIALAGGLSTSLLQVPLLVRLDSSWQGFANSLPDASDLGLATTTGITLPLTIADWNPAERSAALWTFLDTLPVPGDSVDLILSWGIPVPPSLSPVFQSSRGWIAAWPLGDSGTIVADRLGAYPGTPTSLQTIPGVIGNASHFDGRLSKVVIPGSATNSLGILEKPYTISCWARLTSFTSSRFVLGFGEYGSHLKFQALFSGEKNAWFAKDFRSSPAGGYYTLGAADSARWTHLAMTVQGDSVALYIDGMRRSLLSGFDQSDIGRRAVDFAIGAGIDTLGVADRPFPGDLSEVWVQSAARSAAWIRIVAANQAQTSPHAHLVK